MVKNKRGQSTLEYIILVTAVIVVVILFLMGNQDWAFKAQMNRTLNQASNTMAMMGTRIDKVSASAGH